MEKQFKVNPLIKTAHELCGWVSILLGVSDNFIKEVRFSYVFTRDREYIW
jgi:DNA-binding XRE family transcriptional regulator